MIIAPVLSFSLLFDMKMVSERLVLGDQDAMRLSEPDNVSRRDGGGG